MNITYMGVLTNVQSSRIRQLLWMTDSGEYYVSSAATLPGFNKNDPDGIETMVFKSNHLGHIEDYNELGVIKGKLDHYAAIEDAGFTIPDKDII